MWLASQHDGSSAVASSNSDCPRTKGSSSSRSSTEPTATASRGRHSFASRQTSASPDRRCRRRSDGFSTSARSSSTNRAVRAGRLGIECARRVPRNLPDYRAGWWLSTCPTHGAGWWLVTCPPDGPEVIHTHVGRSAVAVRALPGARRSLRSLCAIRIIHAAPSRIGRLAGRCPSGEEAQGDVALGDRQTRSSRVSEWSRSCRLPAALADEEQMAGWPLPCAGCLSPRRRRRVGMPSATPVRAWGQS